MVIINRTIRISLLFCLAAGLFLSGCAANSIGALSKSGSYGNLSERRLLTTDGKKAEEPMNTAEEYEHLGDINLTKGDITASFVNYMKALQMEPGRLSASYKAGRLFLLRGMAVEARGEFEKIIKKDPKNAVALEGMGRAYLLDNDSEKAIEYFLKALDVNPRLWETHDLLGIAYDRERKFKSAIEHYEAAILIKPEAGVVFNNLGVSYYMSGELGKAKEAFTTAIEKGEEGSKVYNNLAITLSKLGEYRLAREAFNRAGSEATAQNNIGYLYMLDGKNKEAAQAFEKAIELNPVFYGKAHDNLKTVRQDLQD
jgi:Flp pilus assembly protein TadD